jgi:predicted O-linked N-acetylglucosamine transferase (SPINDLY family)
MIEILNKGILLHKAGKLKEAKIIYEKILKKEPNTFEVINLLGVIFLQLKKYDESILLIKKAININPKHPALYNNLANAYRESKKFNEAIEAYNKAIELNSNYTEAYSNIGILFKNLGKFKEAIRALNIAIDKNPIYAPAYHERGQCYFELGDYKEAIKDFYKLINLDSKYENLYAFILHSKMKMNDWENYEIIKNKLENKIKNNIDFITPFISLSLIDDLKLQKKNVQNYKEKQFNLKNYSKIELKNLKHKKIKIGYYCADFRLHATTHLTSRLFELHNRDKFETFGFSFNPYKNDEITKKFSKIFDNFFYVTNKTDQEIVALSRKNEIDIAVDLMGYSNNNRTNLFINKLAPIQVNYLAYPGTMGIDCIDYIVADKILIPKESQKYYSEKILYLPNSYQPNSNNAYIINKNLSRKQFGLPTNHFIFCSFNNNYKINPFIFNSWIKILKNTEKSILWILSESEDCRKNLIKEVIKQNLDPKRLIFAERVPVEKHLERLQFADLFLDTYPYNAHTTAIDALSVNVPILTLTGETFASRVASSLLNSINLPELITTTIQDYELLAIELCRNSEKINQIRQRLSKNITTTTLFNMELYTKNLEKGYLEIYERYHNNLPVDHLYI